MSMCPVCRTGILNRVTGKQLFGIPHTDFYIECTHCGAKFIPVGAQFRLVSVATARDPLWKKHLNDTFPADTWAALARPASPGGNRNVHETVKKPFSQVRKSPSGGFMQVKDGSLVVPCGEKTLYFKPAKLNFSGPVRDNVFARAQKPLSELLENTAFGHLRPQVNAGYSRYLPMKSGLFLGHLKERHDPFYREFLNPYGDEKYGTIRFDDPGEADKKGILIVVANGGIYHAALTGNDIFRSIINNLFGRISPEDCFLNGDSIRCRINALLCNNRSTTGIYIHTCGITEEQKSITEFLKRMYSI